MDDVEYILHANMRCMIPSHLLPKLLPLPWDKKNGSSTFSLLQHRPFIASGQTVHAPASTMDSTIRWPYLWRRVKYRIREVIAVQQKMEVQTKKKLQEMGESETCKLATRRMLQTITVS